jgi:plasmid stabilization system protein ParE
MRPRALLDVDDAAACIQYRSGPNRAIRFLRAADFTFTMLGGLPGIGARYEPDEPLYADIRYFSMTRNCKFLAFYRQLPDGIELLRVLHGTCDIPNILMGELGGGASAGVDDEADESRT